MSNKLSLRNLLNSLEWKIDSIRDVEGRLVRIKASKEKYNFTDSLLHSKLYTVAHANYMFLEHFGFELKDHPAFKTNKTVKS